MVADKCPIGPIGLNRLSPNGLIGPIRPFLPSFPAPWHVPENVQIGSLSAILSVTKEFGTTYLSYII